ncbi:MAG: HIT domain-containing protein [Proteobacteria bacterium]|nr:HIT domain-containing protein [Pseudomonadota bacterium]
MVKNIYAPWRKDFIEKKEPKEEGCIFCNRSKLEPSLDSLVVFKDHYSFVVLNKYPYNNGHIMVAPYKHTDNLSDLTKEEYTEIMKNIILGVEVIKEAYNPQGFNIGMNLGSIAGAGVVDHLHWHIVPRWGGDTNFMPVISGTKVLHEILTETFERIYPIFEKIKKLS